MKTHAKPPAAKAKGQIRSKQSKDAARVPPTKETPPRKKTRPPAAMYDWALVCIADPDLRARVETISIVAREAEGATTKKDVEQAARQAGREAARDCTSIAHGH